MSDKDKNMIRHLSKVLQTAAHLQDIESNPLDADQIAMFKLFECEGWTHEQRLEHIRKRVKTATMVPASE